ncbi:MAG: hypothetical protein IT376_13685 [Polyangiaceae bacterium]|nr:hypothetical protein [Polyangiaceae bacterium]
MRFSFSTRFALLGALVASWAVVPAVGCSSDDGTGAKPKTDAGAGAAGADGAAGASGSGGYPVPGVGEECFEPTPEFVRLRVEPKVIVVAPGQQRQLEVVVDPDFCVPTPLKVTSADEAVVASPADGTLDLLHSRLTFSVTGGAAGRTTLTASLGLTDGTTTSVEVPVVVQAPDVAACSGDGAGRVDAGGTVRGTGGLAAASISLQAGASQPSSGSFLWSAAPFDATISCAPDQVPAGFTALGPAVTFGPEDLTFSREIPLSVPVNPAAMPPGGRLRHVTVSYSGPRAPTPRVVPIADPYLVEGANGWELRFLAPWLGTYQAVVKSDAGTVKRQRRVTHRALIGISMGGGGTAMYGLRRHDAFDVLAPLGGPVDWTWMMNHIEHNHMGGFLPNDGTNVPATLAPMPEATLPYEHPSTFNQWWYEYPKNGNGGSFPRSEYVQIFRDLALMFGNPNSYNSAAGGENLPAGVPVDHPSVVGDRTDRKCAVWVDPIDGHPNKQEQEDLNDSCPAERCAAGNTLTLTNYYDDEFNPLGTFPVITVCDGSPQDSSLSPYANTWKPNGNDKPLELALAVDYNGNGVRDENEPVLRQGHEPWDDLGADGVASAAEAGYAAGVNEDPAGDDWHPQYNPRGTEGNGRFDEGEPYRDYGLDGVDGTQSSPYDFGEGDGQFTMAPGLREFLARDSRQVIEQHPWATQPKPLDQAALDRLDLWTDGGTRDLFNFAVDAQALIGTWAGRDRVVHYYTAFDAIPGQLRGETRQFAGGLIDFADIPGGVMMRYGRIDPTAADVASGTGQHVGTADDVTRRLQSALYYIGSRWPSAPRTLDEASGIDPAPEPAGVCETGTLASGSCDFTFTDTRGRTGPVSVNLPPGYANAKLQGKRYPVIFLLHGYGQTPEDLKAAIVFLANWMNNTADAASSRLPKAIMVYVDGRCRPGANEAECIRGTFYTDSVRDSGPKMELWFDELRAEVDRRFRTLPEETIEWVE